MGTAPLSQTVVTQTSSHPEAKPWAWLKEGFLIFGLVDFLKKHSLL